MRIEKIIFVVNAVSYFESHRLPIAIELLKSGVEVHVVAPDECSANILDLGIIYHQVKMSRKGMNPFSELCAIWRLANLFKQLQPDIVHLVTIKPYLYGGVAARIASVPAVVSAVAGLGVLFSQNTFKARSLRALLFPLYYLAFSHKNQQVVFQNPNDRDLLVNWKVLAPEKVVLIRGAGVALMDYPLVLEPDAVPIISFAGRLLIDKGVEVFVEASSLLKERSIEVRFWLIGSVDKGNANSVSEQQLMEWEANNLIEILGYRTDIANLFSQSNIVTLPSFYGEGLPKVLIEAAACGRAVITTDHPGCRDAIEENVTGLLVPINDAVSLADAIEFLIKNPVRRKEMAMEGRKLAEQEFKIEHVVMRHIGIYNELLEKIG